MLCSHRVRLSIDWLTTRFIEDGWSLKKLHRRILLSEAYRRGAQLSVEAALAKATQLDPENRLLWRANARRLSFEEMRDSFLMTTGRLDKNLGGRAEFITFSLDGTTEFFNPVSWFRAFREGRAGTSLRGQKG